MTAQILSLFDTPVVVDELANAVALNAALKPLILERRDASAGVRISNIGGWQSEHDMLQWGGAAAATLLAYVIELADQHCIDIRSPDAPRHDWGPQMWANVSPAQASNQLHTHPGAYWSAVYYVEDGAGGSGTDIGGELVFEDPRMPMVMMTMPNLRMVGASTTPHEPQIALRPKNGRLLLFPAWLRHGVAPHRGMTDRISIAINLVAIPSER